MKGCTLAGHCSFYRNLAQHGELTDYFLTLFCEGNFSTCARYEAHNSLNGSPVPDWIFPNEKEFRSLFPAIRSRLPS